MFTRTVGANCDEIAPDGSEIRLLGMAKGASFVHCTLPPGGVSHAVRHQTVEEIWFILSGRGRVWRKLGADELEIEVGPGVCLDIALGTHFQFRTVGDEPLHFVIATAPPWPGDSEAVFIPGNWADVGD